MISRSPRAALLGALTAVALAAAAVLGACSDDPDRVTFDPDAAPDAVANLPEAATPPSDAGAEPDTKLPFDPRDEAVACASTPCVVQVVAGAHHFCARLDDGTVRCWGDDASGTLGYAGDAGDAGDARDAGDGGATIRPVAGLAGVTQLSAAGATTCARVTDGRVFCWGANGSGELGLGTADEAPHPVPKLVPLSGPATRVDVGQHSACAVLATGKLACWGGDEHWQLARGDAGAEPEYGAVRGPGLAAVEPLAVARTSAGTLTTFALTSAGEVWSWGAVSGSDGIAGGRVSSISPEHAPKRIAELANVTSLASSLWKLPPDEGGPIDFPSGPYVPPVPNAHACALAGGQVYCWGHSDKGALCTGIPDAEVRPAPAPVKSKAWPQQLAIGEQITCARLTDGTIQCCGSDERGRLGTGTVGLYSAFFTPAAGFKGHAVQVAAGDGAVCALVQGGTVECWGDNEHGELGAGGRDLLPHPSATKVAFQKP